METAGLRVASPGRRAAAPAAAIAAAIAALALAALAGAAGSNGDLGVGAVKVRTASDGGATVSARISWRHHRAGRSSRRYVRLTVVRRRGGRALVLATTRVRGARERVRLRLDHDRARHLRRYRDLYVTATERTRRRGRPLARRAFVAVAHERRLGPGAAAGGEGTTARYVRRDALGGHDCSRRPIRGGASLRHCALIGAKLAKASLRRASLRRANLAGADLRGADLRRANLRRATLTRADLTAARFRHARFDPRQPGGYALPEHPGPIERAIEAARRSIDIVIYEMSGPNLVGQVGAEGWLMDAVGRGVDVRIILNGEVFDSACTGTDAASQADCAWNPELDPYYAMLAQLRAARAEASAAGAEPGEVSMQFANNNFNITHQKTIIVDAARRDGRPLSRRRLASSRTARAVVMTGNLQAFPSYWGQRSVYEDGEAKLINAEYEADPAASCAANPDGAACGDEWDARDFGVVLRGRRAPRYVRQIESVFRSDLECGGVSPRTNTNGLLDTKLATTWANGTTYEFPGGAAYPDWTAGGYYPFTGELPSAYESQGNSQARQLALIDGARESLLVYNEEMSDYDYDDPTDPETIVGALARAGDRLGPGAVRVVMAGTVSPDADYAEQFNTLVEHGVRIHLLDDSEPGITYIHAKAIVADSTDAFVGSENFSYPSMNYNRELGLMLTNRRRSGRGRLEAPAMIGRIQTAFATDSRTEGEDWTVQELSESSSSDDLDDDSISYPMACGPIPDRVEPPPSDEQPAE